MSTETQRAVRDLQARIGEINAANGWRAAPPPAGFETTQAIAVLALIGTEVSEAIEEVRNGSGIAPYYSGGTSRFPDPLDPSRPTDDLGAPRKPEGVPSELADIVIRALDFADLHHIDLGAAIEEKLAYNVTREHRHGGKAL